MTPPWPGLGAYAVSKAALDKLVEAWRAEHPQIGFTRVVVGDCAGGEGDSMTGFPNAWDPEIAAEFYPTWISRNYITGTLLEVEELVRGDRLHRPLRRRDEHPVGDRHPAPARTRADADRRRRLGRPPPSGDRQSVVVASACMFFSRTRNPL